MFLQEALAVHSGCALAVEGTLVNPMEPAVYDQELGRIHFFQLYDKRII
jgi:hypothetical protein